MAGVSRLRNKQPSPTNPGAAAAVRPADVRVSDITDAGPAAAPAAAITTNFQSGWEMSCYLRQTNHSLAGMALWLTTEQQGMSIMIPEQ